MWLGGGWRMGSSGQGSTGIQYFTFNNSSPYITKTGDLWVLVRIENFP